MFTPEDMISASTLDTETGEVTITLTGRGRDILAHLADHVSTPDRATITDPIDWARFESIQALREELFRIAQG